MKITFLGTAAATACPLVFCRCDACRYAWQHGATLLTPDWQARLNLTVCPMRHGDHMNLGGRRVTAVRSNHDPRDGSLLWVVEQGDTAFLYATDTMAFTDEAMALFRDRAFRFDAVAIDHTYGPGTPGGGHLCADEVVREIARLRDAGCLKPGCRVLATHLSHEGMPPHEALSAFAAVHGYEVAWDGLTLELP